MSGDVSQGATVQRERCCLPTAPSVWRGSAVHVWTSAVVTGWNQERLLKPMTNVTTGQNNTQNTCSTCLYTISDKGIKGGRLLPSISCVSAPVRVESLTAPDTPVRVRQLIKPDLFVCWCAHFICEINVCFYPNQILCILSFDFMIKDILQNGLWSVFPVSGNWCEWSEWTPCSRTCGAESVSRYRSCGCPEPKAGGAACSGEQEIHSGVGVQIQRQPCPVVTFCPGKIPPTTFM